MPPVVAPSDTDWVGCMRRGDWRAAWRISDAVLAARHRGPRDLAAPRHEQWIWDGSPFAGRRVLVRCYHGLGDTIQFVRLIPWVTRIAERVTLWAQPALIPLLRGMPGLGAVLPLHDGAPDCDYDLDLEIMELAHAFRLTPATVPAEVPYLPVPPHRRQEGPGLAVGVVWRAGDWDMRRSLPPAMLHPLAAIPGVTLHILQQGAARAEAPPGLGLFSGAEDIVEAAAVMASLDLIVTVDSMPAHLAGALGLPVWTLLQAEPDWRWMTGRPDTPWYPTMRLFRQPRAGDWPAVIDQVAEALRRRLAASPAGRS